MLVIPVIWCLIGGSAAFLLAMPADWALVIAALILITNATAAYRANDGASADRRIVS
jgi:hypothetical protein